MSTERQQTVTASGACRKKSGSARGSLGNLKHQISIGQTISHHRHNVSDVEPPSVGEASSTSVDANRTPQDEQQQHQDSAAPQTQHPTGAVRACRYARKIAHDVGEHCTAFDVRKEIAIPRFTRQEIVLGKLLGRGGFSNVYEVIRFDLEKHTGASGDEESDTSILGCPVGGVVGDGQGSLRSSRVGVNTRSGRLDRVDEANVNNEDDNDDSSDDEVPLEVVSSAAKRISNRSVHGIDDPASNSAGDDSDDELVHPTLNRGTSITGFAGHHMTARSFLAKHCIRNTKTKNEPSTARYAIKTLRSEVMEDDDAYMMGAADLVVEARFLACLEHPNIVKMRGMTHTDVEAFASGIEGDFFLIMDRLSETLESRIQTWQKETKLLKGRVAGSIFDRKGNKLKYHLASRLEVAYEIGNALKYLHGKRIIFRDLKPENCGFDVRGDVKLFDFGLAKEIWDGEKVDSEIDSRLSRPQLRSGGHKGAMCTDTYEMSAPCGSYRYMAPEVIKAEPYNLTADTYSFALLVYELCVLKKPYSGMEREELIQKVSVDKYRPDLPATGRNAVPTQVRNYLTLAWSDNLRYRPNMETSCGTIFKALESMKEGAEMMPSQYDRRRSTFVLPKAAGSFRGLGFSSRKLQVN